MVPRARLQILLGGVALLPLELRGERRLQPLHRRRDRNRVVADAQRLGASLRVGERVFRSEFVGQHYAVNALRAERVGGKCGAECRVDAAGKAEHDAGKTVLLDVVAQSHDAGGIIRLVRFQKRRLRAGRASPRAVLAPPFGDRDFLAEARKLEGERAVAIERERGALEDKLVLAAHLVDVDERQARLDDARHRDIEAFGNDAAAVGRGIGDEQNFATGLGDAFDRLRLPDILADRNADADAAEIHRPRQGTGRKDAFLVEDAVIRQIHLETERGDAAAVEKRHGVVELAVLQPRRA